jgi:hypothetical protein
MNTPSTLTIETNVRLHQNAHRPATLSNILFDAVSRFKATFGAPSSNVVAQRPPGYRISDPVRHTSFGVGRVVSTWPDGRLLVRFDGMGKNRLVFPSVLKRVDR